MKKFKKIIFILSFSLVFVAEGYDPKRQLSPSQKPEELKGLEIQENLGGLVDLKTEFMDEAGNTVQLKKYFDIPVLLSIVYYGCPNLCTFHLNGLFEGLEPLPKKFKQKFNVVIVSLDDTETFKLAKEKKANYVKKYNLLADKVHFLTGKKENILALSKQTGFRFRWDDNQKMYAHLPVAYTLTTEGKISRYLYGVLFEPRTLRLSLVEAGRKKIASVVDRILLFCFQFDPKSRRYAWYAYNIMRAGGIVTLLLLFGFLLPVWVRENKKVS